MLVLEIALGMVLGSILIMVLSAAVSAWLVMNPKLVCRFLNRIANFFTTVNDHWTEIY